MWYTVQFKLHLSTETSSMITEKNPSPFVLGGIVPCPMHTVMWVDIVMLRFPSFSHLNPHWVICSGKGGTLLLQLLLDQRHQCVCQWSVPFYTTHCSRRCPTTSNQTITFWHTMNGQTVLAPFTVQMSKWELVHLLWLSINYDSCSEQISNTPLKRYCA